MKICGLLLFFLVFSPSLVKAEDSLTQVVQNSLAKAKHLVRYDRHQSNKLLNKCSPDKNSKILIIAFEGTGAYEPLVPALMNEINKTIDKTKFQSLENDLLPEVRKQVQAITRDELKWSGLMSGPMSELLKFKDSHTIDWYSFPSEEVEQLAGLEKFRDLSITQLYDNISDSIDSNPKGIQNAYSCIYRYLSKAKALKIDPTIVLLSHSSGGRSLIKFAEKIKSLNVTAKLAFTIDPVVEAHHALEEVIPQKIGEPARYLRWRFTGGDYPYSAVWHSDHPSKLYSPSNVDQHLSFFQTTDRLGLKIGGDALRFGIHGSNIEGAQNKYIRGLGHDAHGAICYNEKVLEAFNRLILDLLK